MARFSRRHETNKAHLAARAAYQKRQAEKRGRADERQEYWASLSPQEQLAELDARLGPGVGAEKQRNKIAERLSNEQ